MAKKLFIKSAALIFFFFFIAKAVTEAQTAKIDSIKKSLLELPDDTNKVKAFTQLSKEWGSINPRMAINTSLNGLELSKKIDWKKGIAVNYTALGFWYGTLGIYDTALFYNDSAIVSAKATGDKSRIALTYINRASTLLEKQKLSESQKDFLSAVQYAEESGNTDRIARSHMGLANVYFSQGQYSKAIDNYKTAVHLFDSIGNTTMASIVEMNMGISSRHLKLYEEGAEHFANAIRMQKEAKDITNLTTTYSNAAILEEERGDSAKAIQYYELSFDMAKQLDDKEMMSVNGIHLGTYWVSKGDVKKGIIFLENAYQYAAESNLPEEKFNSAAELARAHARTKNFEIAFNYMSEAMSLNDTILKNRQDALLTEMQTKYETDKKEKENIVLKTTNELQQQKLKARNNLLVGAAIGIILLALSLFLIFRNYRNEKQHASILDKLNRQLTGQRDEILSINQLLQLKVLRTQMNPHFIYNCLNAINNLVMKGENDKASGYLLNFAKLLRMVLDFSDKTFVDIEDEIKFIRLYLSLEAMRMGNDFSYEVMAAPRILEDDIAVPSLLVQPFIENAIWHGLINKTGDKKLMVRFEEASDSRHLLCVVEDNGIGREKTGQTKQQKNGMLHESKGIRITQERIELLRYQVKNQVSVSIIDKKNNRNEAEGTKVELILPIEN